MDFEQLNPRLIVLLNMFGLYTNRDHKFTVSSYVVIAINILIRGIICSLGVGMLVYHSFNLPNCFVFICMSVSCVSANVLMSHGFDVYDQMDMVIKNLSTNSISTIIRTNKRRLLFVSTTWVVQLLATSVYLYQSESTELLKLVTILEPRKSHFFYLLEVLIFWSATYSMSSFTAVSAIYNRFNIVMRFYANDVKLALEQLQLKDKLSMVEVDQVRTLYQTLLNVKTVVNVKFGSIPLLVFITLFDCYAISFTYVVVEHEDLSIGFRYVIFWPMCIKFGLLSTMVVRESAKSMDAIRSLQKSIIDFAGVSNMAECPCVKMAKHSLYNIAAPPVDPNTASGLFEVDWNFCLTFANAVIPFTLMIITSSNKISCN